jgi:hypothetical protein
MTGDTRDTTMNPQVERLASATVLVVVATAFVIFGHLTGAQWVAFVQWVTGFVLAHHVATRALANSPPTSPLSAVATVPSTSTASNPPA